MEIPILKGRGFEPTDAPGNFIAIVNEEFESRYLDGDALGKRFTLNGNVHRIVGVVPTIKHRRSTEEAGPAFYALNRQLTWGIYTYIVRTSLSPRAMLNTLRKTIEATEPSASIVTLETMTDMMRRTVAEERYRAILSLAFGALALLLAAVGLYGLIARSVADRHREIGIRMALGAERGSVLRLVLMQAAILVVSGLIVGVPAALGASQLMATLLYGVTPTSAHTFIVAAGLLAAAAVVAAMVPARRAAQTDPVVALRTE